MSGMPLPGVMLPGLMPGLGAFAGASRIVVLKNAVEVEELRDQSEYEEIVQDMQVRDCCSCTGTRLCVCVLHASCCMLLAEL